MKGAAAIAEILKAEGVDVLPCFPVNPLIEEAAVHRIRPIVCRQERVGVNIADGISRASGGRKIGVFVSQYGPGAENAFAGIAQAFSDSSPILFIPGGEPRARQGVPPTFSPAETYRSVSKWSAVVNSPERIPEIMRRAFTLLRSGRPGPVVLETPTDVLNAELDADKFRYVPVKPLRSMGDPADVKAAARILVSARRPVLYAGAGVRFAEASGRLVQLAELLAAPAGATLTAKSVFPENHPLYLGTGSNTTTRMLWEFLNRADVVAGVGTSFTRSSFVTPVPAGKVMVQITNDPRDINKDYSIDQGIVGDVGLVLDQLIAEVRALLGNRKRDPAPVAGEIASFRDEWMKDWTPRLTSNEVPLSPYRVIAEINHLVDPDRTIVTHDSGGPRNEIIPFWSSARPLTYLGWGKSTQLGFGLGLMIGAKVVHPDHLCMNIMGDAAFGMTGLDFETAVRSNLPILTVVLNNNNMACETRAMAASNEIYGSRNLYGEYAAIARALGGYSERVTQPGEIGPALQRAVKETQGGRAALLEFVVKEETDYAIFPR